MTDPRRLIESCSDDFARALLSSSRDDAGSSNAYQRTLTSLGVGVTVKLAGESAASAAVATILPVEKLGVAAIAKLLSVGAAVGVATAFGLHFTMTPRSSPAPSPKAVVAAGSPASARPAIAEPARSPAPVLSAEPERAPPRSVRSAATAKSSTAGVNPPVAGSASSVEFDARPPNVASSALEREVEMLDAVKQALRRGDGRNALSALGVYEREFARGALAPEAEVLRVRALLAAGDRGAAKQVAERVIESDPEGRHAAVVRALIARGDNP